jgi:protein TonB
MAYQGQRGWNPTGLGVAIAINGSILALLMTMATTTKVISDQRGSIETVDVPIDPPPPPIAEPKPVERRLPDPAPAPEDKLYVPTPPIPVPATGPTVDSTATLPVGPPPPSGTTTAPGGTGTGGTGVEVAPVLPVLVEASVDPRYRADFQPDYPAFERNQAREGVAVVRVLVGTNGRVTAVEPVRATSDAFFEATKRRALSKWRFRPATRDGVAVESWRVMTVRFTMTDE